jgi:hypothetical protein
MWRDALRCWSVYCVLSWTIPAAFEVKKNLNRIPGVGPKLARLIPFGPISPRDRGLNCTDEELKQVKILSALDMPLQTIEEVSHWFGDAVWLTCR